MRNTQVLAAIGCVMVFGAAALDYGLGPLAVAKPRRLPVETFPATIGSWQGGAIQPVNSEVKEKLPTASIIERDYTDSQDRSVDVTLVTASDSLDIHNPLDCFPSQGWHLSGQRKGDVGGQSVNVMDAQQEGQKIMVMYWMTGYYPPPPSRYALVRAVSALRDRIVSRREGESLFVRLMAPATPSGEQALGQMASQIMPSVQLLTEAGRLAGKR